MLDLSGDDELDADVWCSAFLPDAEDESGLFSAGGDLCDGFYQFTCEDAGCDFGFDFPETAEYYECNQVYEDGCWQDASSEELVFPVFVGLAAGWSWAMWAMHATVSHVVGSTSDAGADPLSIEDKRITPVLRPGFPIAGTYVNNFAVLGCRRSDASRRYSRIVSSFRKVGVALHDLVGTSQAEPFEQLGLHFIGELRRLRAKPARAWRLYLGLRGFLQLPLVYGWQVRVLLGHIVN